MLELLSLNWVEVVQDGEQCQPDGLTQEFLSDLLGPR